MIFLNAGGSLDSHSYTHASVMPTVPQDVRNPDTIATLKREASKMKSNVSKKALSQLGMQHQLVCVAVVCVCMYYN